MPLWIDFTTMLILENIVAANNWKIFEAHKQARLFCTKKIFPLLIFITSSAPISNLWQLFLVSNRREYIANIWATERNFYRVS